LSGTTTADNLVSQPLCQHAVVQGAQMFVESPVHVFAKFQDSLLQLCGRTTNHCCTQDVSHDVPPVTAQYQPIVSIKPLICKSLALPLQTTCIQALQQQVNITSNSGTV
jgi:hypothetical protein